MSGFIDRVGGIARLRITGVRPESVLNACALAGIELWGLSCIDECCIDVLAHDAFLSCSAGGLASGQRRRAIMSLIHSARLNRLATYA